MTTAILDTVTTDFRILGRILLETLGGIRRTGWMNLVILITMASILSIFGTLFAFVMEVDMFTKSLGGGVKISVYTDPTADLDAVTSTISHMQNVEKVEVVPRQDAWSKMRQEYEVPDIQNPLPDTIHVKMTSQEFIEPAVAKLEDLPGVEKVNYPQQVLKKLEKVAKATSFVGLIITVFLGTLTMFIISNTIHLLIEARSREIEILRMMGIGDWYIRLPFLFQGAAYGLLGAMIAFVPLSVAEFYIDELFQTFQFSSSGYSEGYVLVILTLMGILVGGGGAALSVRKYLKI